MVEFLKKGFGKQFITVFCLSGILPLMALGLRAQSPVNNKVLKYSLKDGLSFEIANSITQDARGFIWIATSDGLNRFDGITFKVFKSKQRDSLGLLSNYVEKVYTDKAGFIWVGSRDGLSRLDTRTEEFTHYKVNQGRTAKEDVNSIVPARGDNLWVSTYGIGFSYFDAKKSRFINYRQKTFPQLGDDRVICLSEDSQGLLWVGTQEAGLNLFEQKNGVIGKRLDLGTDAPSGRINDIFEDHFHNVWIATVGGMVYYNRSQHKFHHLTSAQAGIRNKRYLSLNEGSDKKLLVGLQDGGLFKLDLGTSANYDVGSFSLEPVTGEDGFNITQRSVQTLFIDHDKNTWVGTYGNGIYMVGNKTEKFTRVQRKHADAQGESMVRFYGMSQDNAGLLWLGTDGDGLLKTSADGSLIKQYKADGRPGSLTDNAILSGFTDSDNNSWFGTYAKGLFLYNRAADNFTNFAHTPGVANSLGGNDVRVIFQDSRKQLWIGSNGGGLSLYNPKTRTFTNYTPANSAISSNDIRAIAEDTNGNLWIGTFGGGLDYFDMKKNKFSKPLKTADEKRSLPSAVVFSLFEDKQQKLWIGTEGDGLLVYDLRKKTVKVFDERTGLANNTVYAIKQAANGILWLSTNKGLSSIDPLSGKIANYDQSDGVQAGQFNVGSAMYNDKRKAMYFGGTQGLNIFYPSQVYKSNYRPGVVITGLQIFDKQVDVDGHDKNGAVLPNVLNETEELVLQPDQPVFSIQYTALNYAYPQKGNFAYKMDGLDKAWNYVGTQRSATYRYLSPGTYVFRVKASNQDGVWFNNYATLQIRVLPPWYKTWWAYLCYVLAAGLLINYYRLYRINQSQLKYEIKIAQLSAEKDKELNERKLSFFTNISHEFRTPLTLIINPVKDMLFGKIEHGNDAGNLHIIYRNARRLLSLVDQLLLFRKAESDTDKLKVVKLNVVTLCREVFLCFNHQARTRFIQFDFVCDTEAIEIYADREKLEIALFNLISNALKFTPEHGFVSCTITDSGDKVVIAIKDSGCGIAEGTGDDLFGKFYQLQNAGITAGGFGIGLYLVKAFIENHKGTISYQSESGKGTVFSVSLLKGKEHLGQQFIFEDVQETSAFLDELIDSDEGMLMAEAEIAAPHMKSEALSSDTKTMLLIDDNQQIRTYLKQIFAGKFEVFEADNGTDGLELVYHLVPDIVISDVMMQGLSGIELCSRIKEDPVLNHIPVILLTASSSPEIKLKGIEGGADDYISKPFEKEMLVARVNGILKSRNNLQKYFYNEITLNNTNDLKISQEYKEFLEKCLQIVEKHLTNPDFSIKTLAAETGMSHSNLYKRIKSISGQSANSFIRFIRLRKAAEILLTTDSTVYETAYKVGLNDLKYFREQFFKLFGINPSDYIKKYRKPFHNNYNINRDVLKEN